METITIKEILLIMAAVLGPGGAAWVAVKGSLNGTKRRVENIETDVSSIKKMMIDQSVCYEHRLTILESKTL